VKLQKQLFFTFVFLTGTCSILFLTALRIGFFTINHIEISGMKRAHQKEILKRSGLRLGVSILFFEEGVVGEISKSPWIVEAGIERDFLIQKVKIKIREAEPFCLFQEGEDGLYYMSETGEKLAGVNFDEGLDFPVLIGEGIGNSELVEGALEILKLSKESNTLGWKEISGINVDSIYGITLFTTDGRQVDFGEGDLQAKWRKVEKIIAHTRKINLAEKYINISSGKIGVVNFKL
jgi:Cell division septal protein